MFQLTFSPECSSQSEVENFIKQVTLGKPIELQTSGSTGTPKILTYPSNLLRRSARKTNDFFEFTKKTRALLCLNLNAIAGKMMVMRAMEGDFNIHIVTASKRPLEFVETEIDFVAMVPLQLRESIKHDIEKLKKIKTILVGGGPISNELQKRLLKHDLTIYHSFGMTETVSHIALKKIGKESDEGFKALNGVHFSTKDGQLVIHAEDLGIEDLVTNDLVNLLSPTTFQWLGRKDFVINSGGYKVHPELLENRWSEFLELPFFIWKEQSVKWGEKIVLYIEGTDWPTIDKKELLQRFKSYEIPKALFN
jgi:O-succinylbenzoic acid--CoA ligase